MYFRGLGDATRLRILELLRGERDLSVGELADRLCIAQPKVSNHLACLRRLGFVESRREHRVVHNRIVHRQIERILDLAYELFEENERHAAACSSSPRPRRRM